MGRQVQQATIGVKLGQKNLTAPDVGVKFESGPMVAAILAKEKFSVFSATALYKANKDLKVAASYEHSKAPKWGLGLAYDLQSGASLKWKIQQDMAVSCGVKHALSKVFTVLAGAKYDTTGSKHSWGLKLSME